jgi:hypothetical protein
MYCIKIVVFLVSVVNSFDSRTASRDKRQNSSPKDEGTIIHQVLKHDYARLQSATVG